MHDPKRLALLGLQHQRLREELRELVPVLGEAIREAAAAGVTQVALVKVTGYTRDQIRQICLPPERRRTRAKASRPDQQHHDHE